MADFQILTEENTHFVEARLKDETIRAEAGALAYMRGHVAMKAPVPGPRALMRASLSEEAAVRPTYTGTGTVVLQASLGGFHAFEVEEKPWILERGAYWASDASVELSVHREKALTSFWLGEGVIDYQTKVAGHGKVVVNSSGPAELVELGDEELLVKGGIVIARSSDVRFSVRRPSRGRISSWLSGEPLLRVYRGPGRVLMSSTPYWGKTLLAGWK